MKSRYVTGYFCHKPGLNERDKASTARLWTDNPSTVLHSDRERMECCICSDIALKHVCASCIRTALLSARQQLVQAWVEREDAENAAADERKASSGSALRRRCETECLQQRLRLLHSRIQEAQQRRDQGILVLENSTLTRSSIGCTVSTGTEQATTSEHQPEKK